MIARLGIRLAAGLALVGLPACGDSPPEPPDPGPEPSNVVTGVLRNNTAHPTPASIILTTDASIAEGDDIDDLDQATFVGAAARYGVIDLSGPPADAAALWT